MTSENTFLIDGPPSSNSMICCFRRKKKDRGIFAGEQKVYLPPTIVIDDIRGFPFPDEKEGGAASLIAGLESQHDMEDEANFAEISTSSWGSSFGNLSSTGQLKLKTTKVILGKHVWRTCFFSLEQEELMYFTKQGGRALGSILYHDISRIVTTKKHKGRFTLCIGKTQEFHLRAKNEFTAQSWVDKISHYRSIADGGSNESLSQEPDFIDGILSKKSSKQVLGKHVWNKKYYKLDHTGWLFFSTDKDAKAKTELIMHKVLDSRVYSDKKERFSITIQDLDGPLSRVLEFQAPDKKTALVWEKMLRRLPSRNTAFPLIRNFNKNGVPQFGLEPKVLECTKLNGYPLPIPNLLIILRTHLVRDGGLDVKGIFRLAPETHACTLAFDQLNAGTFIRSPDVNVVANLIKLWFRQLPIKLFNPLNPDVVASLQPHEAGAMIENLTEPFRSLALWLLDLCVLVSRNAAINSMDAKNLALVFGPNLSCRSTDPKVLLAHSAKITAFMEACILWRTPNYSDTSNSTQSQT